MSLKTMPLLRVLSKDKLIQSPILNRMGVQVARTLAARGIYHMRPAHIDPSIKDKVAEVKRDGMTIFEDFLPPDHFEDVKRECLALIDSQEQHVTTLRHGPNRVQYARTNEFDRSRWPRTREFLGDSRLRGVLEAMEKLPYDPDSGQRSVERLIIGDSANEHDPETEMHSDVFYMSHKAWLYLEDVNLEDCPLVYVKGSHRITGAQLRHIYRHSLIQDKPSRRISADEMKKQKLEETVLTCKKNTLVVANICGYHRRYGGQPGRQRLAIQVSLRSQPFIWWGTNKRD